MNFFGLGHDQPRDAKIAPSDPALERPWDGDAILHRLAGLAARLLDAPFAVIVIGDGPPRARTGPPGDPWLDHALSPRDPIQVLFTGDPGADEAFQPAADLGFRAAAPVVDRQGRVEGVLRIADGRPHLPPTPIQRAALADLADLAAAVLARDRQLAELERERALEQQRTNVALAAAGMATYDWDITTERLAMSDRLRDLIGAPADAPSVLSSEELATYVHPEDRAALRAAMLDGLNANGGYKHEYRVVRPADGRTLWVSTAGVPVDRAEGKPTRVIGFMQDITTRKIDEQQRETLVAELDHRIKNVLAAVQSLAAQSARRASSLESFLKTFSGRLKSMASAHQLLTATRWRGAGMQNIAAAELGGLAPGHIRWEGPDILLTPRATNAMSLALHELATNAVKFGALSVEAGRVEVHWQSLDGGGLRLNWLETGGPRVGAPSRRGFGSTLLEKVTGRELGGEARIDFLGEGVRAVIVAGASALATEPAAAEPAPESPAPALAGASAGAPLAQQAVHVRGLRVLIVEDAVLLALELEAGLQEAGAVVVGSAADLEEAMGMVDLPLDAAVLDANLNGVSVLPVAKALTARGVPFVFATGYGDNKLAPQGFDAPVIRKPYDVTQVAAALAEVTGRV